DVQALLRHGPEAARQAVRVGSHRQAIEMLSRVLAHADLLPPMDAAALRAARGYSLYLVNRFEDSYSDSVAAVEAASEAGGGDVLIEALSVLSKAAFWARGPHVAQDAAARAVDLLTDAAGEGGDHLAGDARMAADLGDLARAHIIRATVGIVAEPSPEALVYADRAVAIAERLGRADLTSLGLNYRGSSRLAVLAHDDGGPA